MKRIASLLTVLVLTAFTQSFVYAQTTNTVFDNQFNTTWDVDPNGNNIWGSAVTTFTPTVVGAHFSEHLQLQVWTVTQLTPQPWSNGGVIFAGGPIDTGAITTEFSMTTDFTYIVDWGVDLVGQSYGYHELTLTVYNGSGTGGTVLGSEILGNVNTNSAISFVAPTTGPATIEVKLTQVGMNETTDALLNHVTTLEVIPEPSTMSLVGFALVTLFLRRRRQKP